MKDNEKSVQVIVDVDTAKRLEKLEADCSLLPEIKKLLINQRLENQLLGDWISEELTMETLGKGKTSLYKLREEGKLIASETRPIFYSLKSMKKYLDDSIK